MKTSIDQARFTLERNVVIRFDAAVPFALIVGIASGIRPPFQGDFR